CGGGVGGRRTARIIPPAAEPRPHPGLPPQAGKGKSRPRLSAMPPSPASGGGLGGGAQADSPDHSGRCGTAPPSRPPPASGEGEMPAEPLRNAPLPRERRRVGVGGAGGQPGSFRPLRHLAPIPAFPRKRGKGKCRPRLSAMISLPRERGRVGGGGRRTPSTPLAAWTLRAHVTPVPHRGDEDGANATGASPCPTCP